MYTRQFDRWGLLICVVSCLGLNASRGFALEPSAEMRLIRVGDVHYMSGGRTQKEREVLTRRAAAFPVVVSFIGKTSQDHVRRVSVTIVRRDEGNSVIRFKTAGPMLLMSLPPGHYTLSAMSPGAEAVHSQLDILPGKLENLEVALETKANPTRSVTVLAASNKL
jgi:hypothetical protein